MSSDCASSPARLLLILADMHTRRGDAVYSVPGIFDIETPDPQYIKALATELQIRMGGTNRSRDLLREARNLEQLVGWRAKCPDLAKYFAGTVRALAAEYAHSSSGNPQRKRGATKIVERRYVNRTFHELRGLARSHGRPDWEAELLRSDKDRLSRGRKLVAQRAQKLAHEDGVELKRAVLMAEIREYVKTASSPINYLALYARKHLKKARQLRERSR